ncbi:MAG: DNA adenine methylase [Ignavibacterium sp.]|nr:DNA adenine methylase [Ignavibacterium sp.]
MITQTINIKEFPTTRYQGSKRKILPWIYENVKDLKFDSVLDAFGGTASVSYLFKKMGKSVTYNDNLKFNYLIGKALIENQEVKINEKDLTYIKSFVGNDDFNFVQKNFKDIYYFDSENKWIDNKIATILNMNTYDQNILDYKRALVFYALFQACLIKRPFNLFHRKNLDLRRADVERSFGNLKTWNTKFDTHFYKFINEANNLIFDNKKKCKAINQSVFDIDENNFELAYFDTPYFRKDNGNETSSYWKTYHFLEGLANYNNWGTLIDIESINKRFRPELSNEHFGNKGLVESFEELFYKFRKSIIVLSYKKGGIPSIQALEKLLKRIKPNVYKSSLYYKYALNRQNGNAKTNREVIIIGL